MSCISIKEAMFCTSIKKAMKHYISIHDVLQQVKNILGNNKNFFIYKKNTYNKNYCYYIIINYIMYTIKSGNTKIYIQNG